MSMYFCVLEHKKTKQELNKSPSLEKKKHYVFIEVKRGLPASVHGS